MRSQWISALLIIGSASGCGAEYRRKDRATKAQNEALQHNLAASEEARKKAEAEAISLKTAVEQATTALAAQKAQAEKMASDLAALTSAATAKDLEIASLDSTLQAKEAELARLTRASLTAGIGSEELRGQLDAAEKAREKAARDLKLAQEEQKVMKKTLEEQRTRSLQAFLENAGPETMFAADTSDMATLFKLDGRECAIVLDIARDIEVVRGTQRERLPNLRGYDVLPMRVAYKKALVCKEGSQLKVNREEGHLFRLISDRNDDERALVTGRAKGSCDGKPAEMLKASVLGENEYQVLNPFRGSIDGIETIDLPRGDQGGLRLHMGSAVVGAPSCARAVEMGVSEDLVTMACQVLLGRSPVGVQTAEGCFTEKKEGDATSLIFNP